MWKVLSKPFLPTKKYCDWSTFSEALHPQDITNAYQGSPGARGIVIMRRVRILLRVDSSQGSC